MTTQLPERSGVATTLKSIIGKEGTALRDIDGAIKQLADAIKDAEEHLAKVLGLAVQNPNSNVNLADRLTVAVDSLAKGVCANFPALTAIAIEKAIAPQDARTPAAVLNEMNAELQDFLRRVQSAISRRYDWWTNEVAPGSKLALLRKAAEHFDAATGECPVCERQIDDAALLQTLTELRNVDPRLASELRTFFADLASELRRIIPQAVASIASRSIEGRVKTDWSELKQNLLGEAFSAIGERYDSAIDDLARSVTFGEPTPLELFPVHCDRVFLEAAELFAADAIASHRAIALLYWGERQLAPLLAKVDELLTSSSAERSLFAELVKEKQSAELVKPLLAVGRELKNARDAQLQIDALRDGLKTLDALKAPLDNLKHLANTPKRRYARNSIRSRTRRSKT